MNIFLKLFHSVGREISREKTWKLPTKWWKRPENLEIWIWNNEILIYHKSINLHTKISLYIFKRIDYLKIVKKHFDCTYLYNIKSIQQQLTLPSKKISRVMGMIDKRLKDQSQFCLLRDVFVEQSIFLMGNLLYHFFEMHFSMCDTMHY